METEHIAGLVGTFLPMAIAVILNKNWQTPFKAVVALLACAVAATITTAAQGQLNSADWMESAAIIFTATVASFKGFWEPVGLADRVEEATSFGGANNGD